MNRTEPSFQCPICGRVTWGRDVIEGYCPQCRAYTRDCSIGGCRRTPAAVAGNVALCAGHAEELDLEVGMSDG